ncbi:MAG: hypothetical protein HUU41_12955 [Bryobacteraceae bacterium]|nr:hypothetical protein [Bryobacterales bacterium]MEB2362753.1 glycosyl hydrolase [Bryobacterales bacterium]NUN02018.1 hypothetical protein [Bryobacteraceae bacterium]
MKRLVPVLLAAVLPLFSGGLADTFRNPPDDARMTMYWIWFGPAVTRESIDRDLANMKEAHIGGTVLLPVYPLSDDDPAKGIRNLPFLSPEFLDILAYTARRSRDMGLVFDVTIGTGWPYGGPWITPELSSRMIRLRKAGAPLKTGEQVVTIFGDQAVVAMPTGMQVKRPSIGDEGLVLDHLSARALEKHLEVAGEKLWEAVRGAGIRSFWCDSLEVYNGNWTHGFPEQFQKLRGYDLKPLLPLLFQELTPQARHVRHDFWWTVSELAVENFQKPLQAWCRRKGVDLQMESYGQPPVSLGSLRYVDRPVGEHYEWRMFNASRWASSGGRLHGRNIIGAEAWTWTGIPNRFADSLSDLKLASDMHFVSGINSLMGISYVNTPPSAGNPGWVPYWGPIINHNQPWWPYFPLLSRYVQRVSHLLRQGRAVADVAVYLPAGDAFSTVPADRSVNLYFAVRDLMHNQPAPEFGLRHAIANDTPVISAIISSGYSFDGIDSSTLPHAEIDAGHLKMGLGDYRVVVLPHLKGMPLPDAEKLAEFVRSGGHVIATERLPELAYGWKRREADSARLRALLGELFAPRSRAVLVPDEREALRAALRAAVPPDVALQSPDRDIAFVHRELPGESFYFLANLSEQSKALEAKFRAPGVVLEVWDPMTGDTSAGWDGTLRLEPRGSLVVRVGRGKPAPRPRLLREASEHAIDGWTMDVPGRAPVRLDRLVSWTELDGLRHYSGAAEYTAEVEMKIPVGAHAVLDLGDVREIADVSVNGRPAGVAWKQPYCVDITAQAQSGRNSIRVRVTNLWINGVLGSPQPDYSALRRKFGPRFSGPAEWKSATPLPSGLLGPARIVFRKRP